MRGLDIGRNKQTQASWLQRLTRWEEQYTAWNQLLQDENSDNPLPQSDSGGILEGIVADELASSVRSNSRSWSALTGDWSTSHATYITAYSADCMS